MAKSNSQYWRDRSIELAKSLERYGMDAYRQIEPAFQEAMKTIQKDINAWYGRFAKNNSISISEAKKWLTKSELAELKWDVQEYIKHGQENALNQKWMKELENASAKYHISRLETLELQTQQAVETAFGNQLDQLDAMTRKVYTEGYYRNIYNIQKGYNLGFNIAGINENQLTKIISKPWAADGSNFSGRIWNDRTKLVNELHNKLTQNCILGKAPDDLIKEMADKFNTSLYNAKRLVQTEQAAFSSMAMGDVFNDLDVEKYEIVAVLDSDTSKLCQSLDGRVFDQKNYEVGVTSPPFHPNCRTVTVPYFDDDLTTGERIARGADGKTYNIPGDMTYEEWKEKYVT